jgi:hypothetical protein
MGSLKVLEILRNNPEGRTPKELMEDTNTGIDNVYQSVNTLRKKGMKEGFKVPFVDGVYKLLSGSAEPVNAPEKKPAKKTAVKKTPKKKVPVESSKPARFSFWGVPQGLGLILNQDMIQEAKKLIPEELMPEFITTMRNVAKFNSIFNLISVAKKSALSKFKED